MLGVLVHVLLILEKGLVLAQGVQPLFLLLTHDLVFKAEVDLETVGVRARTDLRTEKSLVLPLDRHYREPVWSHYGVDEGGDCGKVRDLVHVLGYLAEAGERHSRLLLD